MEDVRVRLASISAGVRMTLIVCAAAAFDVQAYAAADRRVPLFAVLAAGAAGALAIRRLPWDRIVRGGWREPAFLAWSLACVATIALLGFIDGRPDSALSLLFFVPVVFASTTYPLRSVVIVATASLWSFLAVAWQAGSSADWVAMFAAVLGCTALMGAWQARNHGVVRAELALASRTDPLTGCLNRRGFEEQAERVLAAAAAVRREVGVVVLDLDGFKQVNDGAGHAAGDRVLREVGERLLGAAGRGAVVGRLGGDEFALLLEGAGEEAASSAADRLEDALAGVIRASAGVAASPRHGTALDALLAWADARLYETKLRRRLSRPRLIPSPACSDEFSSQRS
jgi:diguanylate cyclase (GGDEF)-like protein